MSQTTAITQKEDAIHAIRSFLNDKSKSVFLLRGSEDKLKIKAAMICLSAMYKRGVIRTSDMRLVADTINGAFGKALLPNAILSTKDYQVSGLTLYISRYDGRTKRNPVGNQSTFTLYLVEPGALNDLKRYQSFIDEMASMKSDKVLILTTDDKRITNWNLMRYVDAQHTYG